MTDMTNLSVEMTEIAFLVMFSRTFSLELLTGSDPAYYSFFAKKASMYLPQQSASITRAL